MPMFKIFQRVSQYAAAIQSCICLCLRSFRESLNMLLLSKVVAAVQSCLDMLIIYLDMIVFKSFIKCLNMLFNFLSVYANVKSFRG